MISDDRKIKEFEILFNEYYKLLKEEIDFVREAKNMKQFKENFIAKKWVKIPTLYESLSNNDVITMEYVPTMKIDNVKAIQSLSFNRERIAQKLVELFIMQVIDFGMVHIDPHPGNVGITDKGKIVFYDFGMVLDLDLKIKEKFTSFLIAVYDKDINTICTIAIEMGLIVVEPQNIPYFKTFLISFLSYVENADIEEFKISYINKINKTSTPFLISSKFVLLLRGISILEGVCKKLDPNFNFKKTLDPYIDQFIVDVNYFEARAISDIKLITKVPDKVQISQIQLEVLEKTVRDVEKNVKKEQNEKYMMLLGVMTTMIMQHEFNQGVATAVLFGISYSLIVNGQIHKK
jgi:predicted unusual protein kinase regulating ubiquinone biosynthesis (AarF/ABC1/UbiB family)